MGANKHKSVVTIKILNKIENYYQIDNNLLTRLYSNACTVSAASSNDIAKYEYHAALSIRKIYEEIKKHVQAKYPKKNYVVQIREAIKKYEKDKDDVELFSDIRYIHDKHENIKDVGNAFHKYIDLETEPNKEEYASEIKNWKDSFTIFHNEICSTFIHGSLKEIDTKEKYYIVKKFNDLILNFNKYTKHSDDKSKVTKFLKN